jgi:cellulose synthase/poly-beta-1,6-N-acetylglucosamine synthase-like glycosyltransferase
LFLYVFFNLLIVLTIGYSLFLILIFVGLCRLREGNSGGCPRVSVIVPARNEERNIETCLQALIAQEYPEDRYQVVVVDDNSGDGTARVVGEFTKDRKNVKLVRTSERNFVSGPKKNAILCGIGESTGEVILFPHRVGSPAW